MRIESNIFKTIKTVIFYCFLGISYDSVAQYPNLAALNTSANGADAFFAIGSLDTNWYAASGDSSKPTTPFVPAIVVGRCDDGWFKSPYDNANWIAYDFGNGCYHQSKGCVDIYYRRNITLPATNICGFPIEQNFCIAMDFYADNSIYSVSINGIENFKYTGAIDPYKYFGHLSVTTVNLCKGWQRGMNSIIVHVKSCPTSEGFLAFVNPSIKNKYYFPLTIDKNICEGEIFKGYSKTGIYVDTLLTQGGCDTIRTIKLTVNKSYVLKEQKTICAGTEYNFHGRMVSTEGYIPLVFRPNWGAIVPYC